MGRFPGKKSMTKHHINIYSHMSANPSFSNMCIRELAEKSSVYQWQDINIVSRLIWFLHPAAPMVMEMRLHGCIRFCCQDEESWVIKTLLLLFFVLLRQDQGNTNYCHKYLGILPWIILLTWSTANLKLNNTKTNYLRIYVYIDI